MASCRPDRCLARRPGATPRDKQAAKRLLRKLLKKQMLPPRVMINLRTKTLDPDRRSVEPAADRLPEASRLAMRLPHPGMLTTAHALLTDEPDADADRIRSALSGNLCRCTGYIPIVEAVLEARYVRCGSRLSA
jgi:hypothetical protein